MTDDPRGEENTFQRWTLEGGGESDQRRANQNRPQQASFQDMKWDFTAWSMRIMRGNVKRSKPVFFLLLCPVSSKVRWAWTKNGDMDTLCQLFPPTKGIVPQGGHSSSLLFFCEKQVNDEPTGRFLVVCYKTQD